MLALAIPDKRLEPIARRRPQVAQFSRGIEIAQLASRNREQVGWKTLRLLAIEDRFSSPIAEASDHDR